MKEPVNRENRWWMRAPVTVSLGKFVLWSFTVADNLAAVVMTSSTGGITYLLPALDEDEYPESEGEGEEDDSDMDTMGQYDLGRAYKKMTPIPDFPARMKTITVDYYPIYNISCLRNSVHQSLMLTVACTEQMLVVYEMTEGVPLLRVRKRYDGAKITAQATFLIAYEGGVMDVYKLDLDIPGIRLLTSMDAHSRAITELGILGEGKFGPVKAKSNVCSEDTCF